MIHPVIMAGGAGTRFWPLSTQSCPKQFLPLIHAQKSMLQLTIENISSWVKKDHIWIVSQKKFRSILKKQTKGLSFSHCLLEPWMRNTAPCIGWAAKKILEKDSEATMVVLPADNWISDRKKLILDLKAAVHFVEKNPTALVTFGTVPTYPATGYGYIEGGVEKENQFYTVRRFVEKPSVEKATQMLQTQAYFWNSGTFVWKAKAILEALKEYTPQIYEGLQKLKHSNLATIYKKFPSISIDYAVMEKAQNVYVKKASFQWTDLGSWEGLSQLRQSRARRWIQLDSKNCFIDVPQKTVATIGVSDLIVVDTPQGLLICHRKDAQRVKEIFKLL